MPLFTWWTRRTKEERPIFPKALRQSRSFCPRVEELEARRQPAVGIQAISLADPALVSVTGEGISSATRFSISADGRYRVFHSGSADLIAADTNNQTDVFLQDQLTGSITLVSSGPNGPGNGDSTNGAISADGRYVVFASAATNFVVGDANGVADIFLKDLQTSAITLVSTGPNGHANAFSEEPVISGNNRYVAFSTQSYNLVPGTIDFVKNVYRKDLGTGNIELVSVGPNDPATTSGYSPSISADGRYVTFVSGESDIAPITALHSSNTFFKDMQTGVVTLINQGDSGPGNADSSTGYISGNGRYVVFSSFATNLAANDTNGTADVFLKDLQTGSVTLVTTGPNGQANGISSAGPVTPDGRFVSFQSQASNLVSGAGSSSGYLVFVKDMQTGEIRLASTGPVGQSTQNTLTAGMSDNGRYVAFLTMANNLVPNDNNGWSDVFVRDMQTQTTMAVSTRDPDLVGRTAGGNDARISANGRYVVFQSYSPLLVPNDTNNAMDCTAPQKLDHRMAFLIDTHK